MFTFQHCFFGVYRTFYGCSFLRPQNGLVHWWWCCQSPNHYSPLSVQVDIIRYFRYCRSSCYCCCHCCWWFSFFILNITLLACVFGIFHLISFIIYVIFIQNSTSDKGKRNRKKNTTVQKSAYYAHKYSEK